MSFLIDFLAEILLYGLGAFICWAGKGFRGKYEDELIGHDLRNILIGGVVIALAITGYVLLVR